MCYKCVEKRGDLSEYKEKRLEDRLFRFVERSSDFHDTGNLLACSACGVTAFRGDAVYEANTQTGGKWILQCVACKRIQILSFRDWEPVLFGPCRGLVSEN